MRLTICAATGGIGRLLLQKALDAGHDVTAVVRNPGKLPEGVNAVKVDLMDPDPQALSAAIEGADAVLSGLGAGSKSGVGVAANGTRAIIAAMQRTGVQRLVVVSAAPIGTVASPARPQPPKRDPGDDFAVHYLAGPIIKRILRQHYADLAEMEDAIRACDLQWTVIRPPKLTDKPSGDYRTAIDQNIRGGHSVSRIDVADSMLRVLDQAETIGRTVGIAN